VLAAAGVATCYTFPAPFCSAIPDMGQLLSECLGVLPSQRHYESAPRLACREDVDMPSPDRPCHSGQSSPGDGSSSPSSLPSSPHVCASSSAPHSNLRLRQTPLSSPHGKGGSVSQPTHSVCTSMATVKTKSVVSKPCWLQTDATVVGAAEAVSTSPLAPNVSHTAIYDLLDGEAEDLCPTCLEEYNDSNPKVSPRCGHAFHLQCVLAWAERSASKQCPVCSKDLDFDGADALML
jgi:RING-H2 zinc finger domain